MAETRSPPETAVQSQKRPLEEPSSPSGPTDGPNAKRPALDKVLKENGTTESDEKKAVEAAVSSLPAKVEAQDLASDASALAIVEPDAEQAAMPYHNQDESTWLHLRAIISSAEAATVIGKGGENVTQIRKLAGAKCTVSEYSRGAVERILTVSGPTDAVAKAFGLIIRTLNQEPLEASSTPQSKTYPLRLLIPHILIGSIIGKSGVRIREIQEASGARLNASESCLPLSSERSLVVLGVADAVHIATYYVGRTLVEQLTERFGGPAASAYASRHGTQGAMPGGMQVSPYVPMPAGGQMGHESYRKARPQPYMPYAQPQQYSPRPAYTPYQAPQPQPATGYGQPITQQIYIPNDMVGAIIGKGGAKINEIRQLSGSVIKINEPQDNSNERLVTVTGTSECNQMALYMLYSRLGESSKNSNPVLPR